MIVRVRSLLVVLVATMACATGLGAQETGTIVGQITDVASLQPVDGVTVTVADQSAVSRDDGRYMILRVPTGTHTLEAERLGYATYTQEVTVRAGETLTVDIRMVSEAVQVEGLVVVSYGYGVRTQRDLTGVVDAVSREEFNAGRVVSAEQLIQGKIPGVQIIDSGEPGAGISLRIRGGTSVTSSNEPLFVVDGVPLQVGGGISAGRNPLNFLNPEDIASVTVLKDASATAIYGSRGANGVVLIETKEGEIGAPEMTYTGSVSGSTVIGDVDVLNATEFRDAVSEYAPNSLSLLGSANTDWRDEVQRSALGQEHTVAMTGGSDQINYRLSLGYLSQEGVVGESETERLSVAMNFEQLLMDQDLKIEANVKGSRSDDRFTPGEVLGESSRMAPTQPILDPSSQWGGYFEWMDPLGPNNPVAALDLITDEGTTYRSVGNITGEYNLPWVEGLVGTVNLGYDVMKTERQFFAPTYQRGQAESGLPGRVSRSNNTQSNILFDAYLNYQNRVGTDGDLDVTAGYSFEESESDYPSFNAQGLSFNLLGPYGIPAADLERTFLTIDESRLVSGFARVNYTFRDKYLFTASVRRDGSSKFGPDEEWGTFPSAAFAWRLSDEPFMQDFESLSDLKLRLSWGVNGNQAFDSYQAFSSYQIGDPLTQAQFGDEFVTTIRPSAADPGIKWEETTSYNLGVDYGFKGGRFLGTLDYYYKETEDLIFTVPVAAGTNLSNYVTTNIGTLENRGFELGFNALIFTGENRGFFWDAGFNISTNKNELTQINAMGTGDEAILTGGIAGGVGSNIQVLMPGHPVNSFYTYRHIKGADGKPVYADRNGDGVIDENDLYEDINDDGIVNQDDRSPSKNPAPDWIIGHTSYMTYGNFDAGFTLLAYLGNYVYNNVASNLGNYRELEGAVPVNLHSSVLEYNFHAPQYFSDVYVEDGSFLRMDNISVGYTFDRGRFAGTRVYGTVQNVFTLTGYSGIDPLAGVNGIDNNLYPRSRTFTAGVRVGF